MHNALWKFKGKRRIEDIGGEASWGQLLCYLWTKVQKMADRGGWRGP